MSYNRFCTSKWTDFSLNIQNICGHKFFTLEYTGSILLISIPYQAMLTLSYILKESKYTV